MLLSFLLLAGLILLFFLDQPIRNVTSMISTDQFLNIMGITSDIGSWVYLSIIALAILGFGHTRNEKKLKIAGKYGLYAVVSSRLIVEILKHLFGRPRPALFDSEGFRIGPTFTSGYDAFPSGHAGSSFAFAYILSKLFPKKGYIFYGGAIIISFSRVYLDVHYASDIYAGGIVGIISGMVVYKYLETKRIT